MNQLTAHIKCLQGNWIVSFSRGEPENTNQFTAEEIRDISKLWIWLASMTSRQTPDRKWSQKSQAVVLRNGGWYLDSENLA